jgi:hypothetical protein
MNWIVQVARDADPRKDRVILENPAAVRELDEVLTDQYYPRIMRMLQQTGYPFSSIDNGKIPIESRWDGPDLGRCLIFMIFNELSLPILRGSVTRSRNGFMFAREFFLALPRTTDPSFLFRILAEDGFAGNKPSLTIEASAAHPEWDVYYWIMIESGTGIESGQWTLDRAALGNIEETISTSIQMYESTIDGFETMADVEEFIALARTCFEAS